MQLAYTILYVDDVPASSLLREGFRPLPQDAAPKAAPSAARTGTTTLAMASLALIEQLGKHRDGRPQEPAFEIAFSTDDVPAALDRALAAGATLAQEPQLMPWGQTTALCHRPERLSRRALHAP
jgi:hypothetical protein